MAVDRGWETLSYISNTSRYKTSICGLWRLIKFKWQIKSISSWKSKFDLRKKRKSIYLKIRKSILPETGPILLPVPSSLVLSGQDRLGKQQPGLQVPGQLPMNEGWSHKLILLIHITRTVENEGAKLTQLFGTGFLFQGTKKDQYKFSRLI